MVRPVRDHVLSPLPAAIGSRIGRAGACRLSDRESWLLVALPLSTGARRAMTFSLPHRVSIDDAFTQFIEWLETRGGFAERTRIEYRDDVAPRGVSHRIVPVDGDYVRGAEPPCATWMRWARRDRQRVQGVGPWQRSDCSSRCSCRKRSLGAVRHNTSFPRAGRPTPACADQERVRAVTQPASDDTRTAALIELILQTGMSLSELARLTLMT